MTDAEAERAFILGIIEDALKIYAARHGVADRHELPVCFGCERYRWDDFLRELYDLTIDGMREGGTFLPISLRQHCDHYGAYYNSAAELVLVINETWLD